MSALSARAHALASQENCDGEPYDTLQECGDALQSYAASIQSLRAALEDLMEVSDLAPEKNCSCHLSPPCNDCVEWSGLRDAIANAREVLLRVQETR